MKSRILAALATCAVLALGIAAIGCGDDNNDNTTASTGGGELTATPDINVAVDQTIADAMPADVKSSGKLTVASDPSYAPMEFYGKGDNTTIIGADADIAKAIGQVSGLQTEMQRAIFDDILAGLAANRYNMSLSAFTDTKERQAQVDFVDYAQAGTTYYATADSGVKPASPDDLCDHKVAVEKGTTQEKLVKDQQKKCDVELQSYPDQSGANLALNSGRAEIGMADSPVADYAVKQSDGKLVLGSAFGVAPYGIAIPKDSGLAQPVLQAVQALYDDGTMQKIIDYWGLEGAAIDQPQINGATE